MSVHALATDESGAPIGCARLLADGHIGRVAVMKAWRGHGVGASLMACLIERARVRGDRSVIVNAQVAAMHFYERLGFSATGDTFDEAGIPHRVMTRALSR
jgi:predicted GNAT family N-acyltransferase